MAKVLLLNGSPKANGCTATALNEMISVFNEEGRVTGYSIMLIKIIFRRKNFFWQIFLKNTVSLIHSRFEI